MVEPLEIEIGLHVMKGNLIKRLPGGAGVQLKKAAENLRVILNL